MCRAKLRSLSEPSSVGERLTRFFGLRTDANRTVEQAGCFNFLRENRSLAGDFRDLCFLKLRFRDYQATPCAMTDGGMFEKRPGLLGTKEGDDLTTTTASTSQEMLPLEETS